ncbi:MAG: hypothetical protein GX446_00635 [Chthonomonadales bacterium]|nr:hypothetical protein [Chthonomonadales bacterium]
MATNLLDHVSTKQTNSTARRQAHRGTWTLAQRILDHELKLADVVGRLGQHTASMLWESVAPRNILLLGAERATNILAVRLAAQSRRLPMIRVDVTAAITQGRSCNQLVGAACVETAASREARESLTKAVVVVEGVDGLLAAQRGDSRGGSVVGQVAAFLTCRSVLELADSLRRPFDLQTRGWTMVIATVGHLPYHPAEGYRFAALHPWFGTLHDAGVWTAILPIPRVPTDELRLALESDEALVGLMPAVPDELLTDVLQRRR